MGTGHNKSFGTVQRCATPLGETNSLIEGVMTLHKIVATPSDFMPFLDNHERINCCQFTTFSKVLFIDEIRKN